MKQPRFRPALARGCIAVLASALPVAGACAQDRLPSAIGDSDRAAFQPQGFGLGGFRLYPSLRATTTYDDNVFLRRDDKVDDVFVSLAPTVRAQSQWARHSLNANAFLTDKRYARSEENNNDEYGATVDGRLDVQRTFTVSGTAGYSHLVEPRGSAGDLLTSGRYIEFNASRASVQASKQINRVRLEANANFAGFRYEDVVTDGTRLDQQFRDRNTGGVGGRIEYQYSGTTSLFVSGTANHVRYREIATDGVDRASSGTSALVGVRFELTRLLSGEVGVGYISQSFRNPLFASFSGLNYNANLNYAPTQLTTVTFSASRNLTDSALRSVGGVLSSRFTLAVEHELLRYLLLRANGSYTNDAYRGIDRTDNRFGFGLGVRYKFNRFLSTALSYDRSSQTTSIPDGRRYDGNRFSLSLIGTR